jgi:hypothetical protein
MEGAGFTKVATTLALKSLGDKGFVEYGRFQDESDGELYNGYSLTKVGWAWILNNHNQFVLRSQRPPKDDIPF